MVNIVRNIRFLLISGLGAAAVGACAPSHHMSAQDTSMDAGYGYSQSGYGYDAYGYEAAGYSSEYRSVQSPMEAYRSRYGAGLRGACQTEGQSCGMMAVVPVYPVYQIVTQPQPDVQVVEAPQVIEPDPVPYVEPAPVYEPPVYEPPVHHWPEPKAPVTDWKPLRK